MTTETEQTIMRKFPLLYRDPLVWGLEHGDGWATIIERLSAKLETLIAKLPIAQQCDTYAVQVKQKFGGLRFYLACPSEAMWHAIAAAEVESFKTCEDCGKSGRIVILKPHWTKTLCDTCAGNRRSKR